MDPNVCPSPGLRAALLPGDRGYNGCDPLEDRLLNLDGPERVPLTRPSATLSRGRGENGFDPGGIGY